jgi:hypothetical protein
MIHPDDVEDGEVLFEPDGEDLYEALQETRYYDSLDLNKPRKSDGFAPADFIYDPIGK